ncbi:DNA primase [Campylobacter sp. MIT 99-7217]|uniref:DNA primase n=1 Tax=Campylobacter sp. MIT 99-7217 TaxID=535091 RepID=UPI00115755E6|nr:DNA primase [Campylobacter sp. MIT 99-7217]TQR32382.1 DNA primase [Campylobacter sp. MIT 99-7217]
MISKRSIEELRSKADIVDVISHFVEVRKQGASFVCVCPFHDDKNPSMHINQIKGFYHCFACKAGGDVFKFVQDIERSSFSEAVEKVASWSNFSLVYTSEKKEDTRSFLHILPLLNAFYKSQLVKHQEALRYLYARNLDDEDIKKFELGFAPSNEETLRLLRNENIDFKDALEVGAIKQKNPHEVYASFIQRISFPIYDHKGLLIGFGGRTLNAENMAKYVNSPQSRLFDKSRILYAFHLAKDEIIKKKEMIICEGYMDAIAFHKAGLKNAVAVLGTALTKDHLPLIKRLESKVILCFDSDEAGLNAALRSAHLLSLHKIDGKVVILKGGKDPAELVSSGQSKALFDMLDMGIELGEFFIRQSLSKMSLNTALEKQNALELIQKYTFLLEPLVAQTYTSLVANLLGVESNFIKLVQKQKSSPKLLSSKPEKINLEKLNLAEFEIFKFLYENKSYQQFFLQISDTACFKHKNTLEKVLDQAGIEDSLIREMLEFESIQALKTRTQFFLAICKINLGFLNRISNLSFSLGLKKQMYIFLDKNSDKMRKKFNEEEEFLTFFLQSLIFIKQEKDESKLSEIWRRFQKYDFDLSINENF